jgi:hypothetical protein
VSAQESIGSDDLQDSILLCFWTARLPIYAA